MVTTIITTCSSKYHYIPQNDGCAPCVHLSPQIGVTNHCPLWCLSLSFRPSERALPSITGASRLWVYLLHDVYDYHPVNICPLGPQTEPFFQLRVRAVCSFISSNQMIAIDHLPFYITYLTFVRPTEQPFNDGCEEWVHLSLQIITINSLTFLHYILLSLDPLKPPFKHGCAPWVYLLFNCVVYSSYCIRYLSVYLL